MGGSAAAAGIAAAAVAAATILLATSAFSAPLVPNKLPTPGTYKLQRIMATPEGQVLDSDGTQHPFSTYARGKVTLLTFMYTSCADADGCPLAYAVFRALKTSLDGMPEMKQKVRFVSLSFDPAHDTPEVMRNYGGDNARDLNGLRWYFLTTHSRKELKPLLDGLDQDLAVAVGANGSGMIMMSHLLKVFLIDPKGQVREIYTSSFLKPEVIKGDIQTLLMEQPGAPPPGAVAAPR